MLSAAPCSAGAVVAAMMVRRAHKLRIRHPDRGSCARSQVQLAAAPEGGMARAPALQAESLRRRRGGAHMPRSQRTPDNGGLRCRQAVQSAPHASWPDRCRPQGARGALRCPTEAGHSILKAQVGLR